MNKDLRNRMIEKNERHRIKRNAKRRYRRLNPTWDANMVHRPNWHAKKDVVSKTRFQGIFNKKSNGMVSKFKGFVNRMFGRKGQ